MSITEAFGRGLPVIASRIGALPELVEDGVTGLLFEPSNSDDLARMLRQVALDGRLLDAMGGAARKAYETRYSGERAYGLLLSAYLRAGRKPALAMKQTSEAHVI